MGAAWHSTYSSKESTAACARLPQLHRRVQQDQKIRSQQPHQQSTNSRSATRRESREAAAAAEAAEGEEAAEAREVAARSVYQRALQRLREAQKDAKEEAVMLLQAWLAFEQSTSRCNRLTISQRHCAAAAALTSAFACQHCFPAATAAAASVLRINTSQRRALSNHTVDPSARLLRRLQVLYPLRRSEEEKARAVEAVQRKMPRAVKRKRRVLTEDGMDAGMEEYLVRLVDGSSL